MMRYWRAVSHNTGAVLYQTQPAAEGSWQLASDGVDLRYDYAGQGDTVTLECVDDSGTVVARWAPHPAVKPLPPERLAALIQEFGE